MNRSGQPALGLCILMDLIGYLSYTIPGIMEFTDIIWAPISATDERKLSFRESELLRLLYAHRDRIIDRREILNLLWGNDSFFNSRNLDVYITKLRSYLREDEQLSIITIKGVGYRFAVGG